MTKRNLILVGVLAFSYLLMTAYLSYRYPEQSDLLFQIAFGVVLIGAAIIGLKVSKGSSAKKGIFRALKILFASYALAFAAWMLGSALLLPLFGYAGFELLKKPIFMYILLGLTLAVSPVVAKRLA